MKKIAQQKSLVTKLAEACNAVGGVEKKGRNQHQNYDYVRAADVAKAIRHELFKRQILLLANEKNISQVDIQLMSGNTMRQLTLEVEYTLLDGESSEKLSVMAYGIAMDSGDKALWKAKTGALKYFLRGLGIIPDEKDDPEKDESVDEATDERIYREPKNARVAKERIAEYQARAWDAACRQSGKTAPQIAEYLRVTWNITRAADLAKGDFTKAIRWATGNPEDLAQDIAQSVELINAKKNGGKKPQPVVAVMDQGDPEENLAGD